MENRSERACALFRQGYNCAQAVLMAYAEDVGLTQEQAARLSSSFGGGMAQLREVCGAVSAMFMIAGLRQGYATPDDPAAKKEHYQRIRALAEQFKQLHSTINCRELLLRTPQDNQRPHGERPCMRYVADAADIISRPEEGQ